MFGSVRTLLLALQALLFLGLFGAGAFYLKQGTIPLGLVLIVVSLVSGGVLFVTDRRSRSAAPGGADVASGTQDVNETEDAPWRARPEWRTHRLTHEHDLEWTSFFGPVLANLFAWPAGGLLIYAGLWDPEFSRWMLLIGLAIIGGFGLYPGWVALRRGLRHYKFSPSRLDLDTMPARLGQRLYARLYAPFPPDAVLDDGVTIELACKEQYLRSRRRGRRRTSTVTKWADKKKVRGHPVPEREGGLEVPVAFDVPEDLPPSPPNKTRERILWELTASANLSGVDYEASFELPVFEPDVGVSEAEADEEEPVDEDVFWELGADGDDAVPKKAAPDPTVAENPAVAEHAEEATLFPEYSKIHVEGAPDGRLRVQIDAGGECSNAASPFLIGLFLAAVGSLLFTLDDGIAFLIALGILPLGLLIMYVGLRRYAFSGEVTVTNGQITARSGLLGGGPTHTFPCSLLEDANVTAMGGTSDDARNYTLSLNTTDPDVIETSTLGKALAAKAADHLAGTVLADDMKDRVREADRRLKIGENITNKAAADRAAALIVKAADRQSQFE